MPITNDVPPSGARNNSSATKRTAKVPAGRAARQEALEGFGQLAQVPLIATKQYADAAAIGMYWPNISKELAVLAEQQPVIANFIDPLIQVGPYTGLVTAVLPLVLQVMVNHGVSQPGVMGTVPKNALSAQMEASLAQVELAAMQAQRDAELAAQKMREDIERARREMNNSVATQATVVSE